MSPVCSTFYRNFSSPSSKMYKNSCHLIHVDILPLDCLPHTISAMTTIKLEDVCE